MRRTRLPRNAFVTKSPALSHNCYEWCAPRAWPLSDDTVMDGSDGHQPRLPAAHDEHTRERIAEEFARIIGHVDSAPPIPRDDIDIATYLLDPPATPERLEQRARRQRIVGVVSLIACVLLAGVLVLPWPSGDDGRAEPPRVAGTEPVPAPQPSSAPQLPRRVDLPRASVAATRLDAAPKRQPPARVSTGPRPSTAAGNRRPPAAPARPARVAAAPREPAPSASAAAPTMLVPLS